MNRQYLMRAGNSGVTCLLGKFTTPLEFIKQDPDGSYYFIMGLSARLRDHVTTVPALNHGLAVFNAEK